MIRQLLVLLADLFPAPASAERRMAAFNEGRRQGYEDGHQDGWDDATAYWLDTNIEAGLKAAEEYANTGGRS
jgi:hypothetical protein